MEIISGKCIWTICNKNSRLNIISFSTIQDPSTLEYWEYDKLGTSASAGCVRLTVADAKWIYDNCKSGTKVEFYSDENPGPLGKPTAKKISNEDENVRIWDPTDSRDNNPWKTYNPNKIEDEKNDSQIENKQNENNTVLEEVNNTVNNNTTNNNNITSNKKEETNVIKNNTIEENSINKIN